MTRVPVNPELLRWARERAGRAQEDLALRFKKLPDERIRLNIAESRTLSALRDALLPRLMLAGGC
ncbi:MAG: hypothetical protein M2R45_00257 [Verrucomicrobia subdivision 3 bacterium]|nr:hypothetical protein [Limisphaerales bacterium]MCS1412983.1 hypothetical protein [Limisphaerales bacterium]